MMTKNLKKTISVLTLSLLLSGVTLTSVSAASNDSKDSKQNAVTAAPSKAVVTPRLGGGPSDSAVWEKQSAKYVNLSHDQLDRLNRLYSTAINGSIYDRGKNLYNVACLAASAVGGTVMSLTVSGTTTFAKNYWSVAQTSANTINNAYYKGGVQALYVTTYYRPSTGEIMYGFSWY